MFLPNLDHFEGYPKCHHLLTLSKSKGFDFIELSSLVILKITENLPTVENVFLKVMLKKWVEKILGKNMDSQGKCNDLT